VGTHTGICRTARRFPAGWLADLAERVEAELASPFERFGARLRVLPIRISHLRSVGEGVELALDPHDPKAWAWWGEFESDLEVRRRARFSRHWHDIRAPDQVEAWLRMESEKYLAQLRGSHTDIANPS
jgi:hypothetical protein